MKGLITRTVKEYTVKASKLVKEGNNWKEIPLEPYTTCDANETYERFLKKYYKIKDNEKLLLERTEKRKLVGMPLEFFLANCSDIVDGKLSVNGKTETAGTDRAEIEELKIVKLD